MTEDKKQEVRSEKLEKEIKSQKSKIKKEGNGEKGDAKEEKTKDKKESGVKTPELKPGMTVRVYQKIKELNIKGEEKERIQYFEGIIIAKKHGKEAGGTITVRKVSNGIGVEKIFPLNLPSITKIEIKKQAKVRRSKLYFLKRGYKKKLREKKVA